MEVLTTLAAWRERAAAVRAGGGRLGLVPTMGALHAGHASLIDAARRDCDRVMVTSFVNPRQFNDAGDLSAYPRTPEADRELCERAGADALVVPTLAEMWPSFPAPTATTVSVRGLSDDFEGADRPGHFDGVASVVTKLFNVTGPCHAYFGEKDYQQLVVISRLVDDLAMPVTVVGCPIVRDARGLALSSRNARLDGAALERARGLSRALGAVSDSVVRTASQVRRELVDVLAGYDLEVAYADVVDPVSLRRLGDADGGPARVLLAGVVDGVRLLDNGPVVVRPSEGVRDAAGH